MTNLGSAPTVPQRASARRLGALAIALAAFVASFAVVSAPSAEAAPVLCPVGAIEWVGPAAGDFAVPANWSTNAVPTATDDACIGSSVSVTVSTTEAVRELVSFGDVAVTATGDFTINGDSFLIGLAVDGALTVNAGTTEVNDFTRMGNGSSFEAGSGAVLELGDGRADLLGGTIEFTGAGTVLITATLVALAPSTLSSPTGTLSIGDAACGSQCANPGLDGGVHGINLTGDITTGSNLATFGLVVNQGLLHIGGRASSQNYGAMTGTFTNDGTIDWFGNGPYGIDGGRLVFTNNGSITVTGTARILGFYLSNPSTVVNAGTITVAPGGFISTVGVDWQNDGVLVVDDFARMTVEDGATYNGGNGDFTNTGSLDLGAPFTFLPSFISDSLSVGGDFVHDAGASLTLGISGDETSVLYPTVVVGGSATFDGALVVERRNGYDPSIGTSYPVFTYTSASGAFDPGPGPFFEASVGATDATVTRILPDSGSAASEVAAPGGTVATDPAVNSSNPLATSVQSPTGGLISIVEVSPVPTSPPSGYEILGTEFSAISAPTATAGDPLLIEFTLDWSVWGAYLPENVSVLRNGTLVGDCAIPGSTGVADPDPCIGARNGIPGGDLTLSIRTSEASEWVPVVLIPTNTDPTVSVDPVVGPVSVDAEAVVVATITDPDVGDTHTCLVEWGDGTSDTVDASGLTCQATHGYGTAGLYTVSVTVFDAASSSATDSTSIVVYDAGAGFITGGGWYISPSGSSSADPSAEGKTKFDFQVKYKKNATVPSGTTKVRFKAADLDVRSSTIDWLVVDGTKATWSGSATVNGEDGFRFTAWIDASLDTVRFLVTDGSGAAETVVYDTSTGVPLGGGSVKVHKGKG